MTQVFLNYRVVDEPFGVAMLDQALSERFGSAAVFLASKSIPLGARWRRQMYQAVADSTALLVIIGRNWVDAKDDQGRRALDNTDDFVRNEILLAFELEKQVIPVRLGVPRVPAERLPDELKKLIDCQDIEVRFRSARIDIDRLASKLREQIPALRAAGPVKAEAFKGNLVQAERVGQVFQSEKMNFSGDFHAGPRFG
jgi:TIR domain